MARLAEVIKTIRIMPWRGGLITAGQQATIDETALWKADNATADLDGLLGKRPGLRRWGQVLRQPDAGATGSTTTVFEPWLGASWVDTDSSTGLIVQTARIGSFVTAVEPSAGTENFLRSKAIAALPAGSKWSLRIMYRAAGVPDYTAAATTPNTFFIRGRAATGSGKEIAIHDAGIYYKRASDNTYVLIASTGLASDGGWHAIDFVVDDAGGTATISLDDTQVLSIPSATLADVSLATNAVIELGWRVAGDGTTKYSTEVGPVMYNDVVTGAFVEQTVIGITDFRFVTKAGSTRRALVVAAGDYVYHDIGQTGAWRVLRALQYGQIFFAPYRRTLLWCDFGDNVPADLWQWDGENEPESLTDAPNVKFVTEHKQRVWGAGDKENPLRVFYTGDRQPNLWFSPGPDNIEAQEDAALQAGYIEIPSKKGDSVVALFGDFYGLLLIFTRRGVWQLQGDGPASFILSALSQSAGCENANCVTQVGNDLWFLGRFGVHSLLATNQFGDLQVQMPSVAISNFWGQHPRSVKRITRDYLDQARLKYNPTQGLVYAAVSLTGSTIPDSVFVYNTNTQKWYGPWSIDSQAMENVEIAPPEIEAMMHGGSNGEVRYTDHGSRRDGADAYTMTLETAYLDGRSIPVEGALLSGMVKRWRRLRLYVQPRGNWDFTLNWVVDGRAGKGATINQNRDKWFVLGDVAGDGTGDFRLDLDPDGKLRSMEQMVVIEVKMDDRGRAIKFTIEQAGVGQDFVIQGIEVDFAVSGDEEK